jgi:uncharacterized protein (DUF697 family)
MEGKQDINKGLITKTLDWAYSKAVTGFTGVDSAYALAETYLKQKGTIEQQVDSLIRWQVAKASASGFTMGMGGLMTMPLTIPANIASVIYIQIRMISAIAHMGGYDINSDKVKSMVYICMVGNGAKELLKDVGVKVGQELLTKVISRLTVKIGEKSASSLSKAVPLVGGVIGGSIDAASTRVVGKIAKKIFIEANDAPSGVMIEEAEYTEE